MEKEDVKSVAVFVSIIAAGLACEGLFVKLMAIAAMLEQ